MHLLLVACVTLTLTQKQRYAGWEVLKFGGLTQLQLHNFSSHDDLDVWSIAKAEHGDEPLYSATALVPPHRLNDVLHTFGNRHSSHTVEVLDSDLDATLFQEKEAIEKKRQSNWTAKDDSFFSTFRPYEDHVALMRQLSDEHPDVMTILPFIGRTVEGREIPAGRRCCGEFSFFLLPFSIFLPYPESWWSRLYSGSNTSNAQAILTNMRVIVTFSAPKPPFDLHQWCFGVRLAARLAKEQT